LKKQLVLLSLVLFVLSACITSVTPVENAITLTPGQQQLFTAKALLSSMEITWQLDGVSVGTGASFNYTADQDDIGMHALVATCGKYKHKWQINIVESISLDWPMYQGGASHTGYIPVRLDTGKFGLLWEKEFTGEVNPVAAVGNKVFVSRTGYFTDSQGLSALDVTSGEVLWEVTYGQVYHVSPPSYDNGVVYIQTGKGSSGEEPNAYLRAYDSETGEFNFRSVIAAQWERYYSPTIYDGTIYAQGGYYGGCYAFNPDGTQLWWLGLNQYDEWTPAVDESFAYAYVQPILEVIDRRTGIVSFGIEDPNFDWPGWSMDIAPVLYDNRIIAVQNTRLVVFDLESKTISYEIDSDFDGQPAVNNGVIYCFRSGSFEARDLETGQRLWAVESPDHKSFGGSIIVTDSHAIISSGDNTYAVSLSSHEIAWSYPGGTISEWDDNYGTSPVWSNGILYLIVDGTKLVAINAPAM
jgi:hypothetical protein